MSRIIPITCEKCGKKEDVRVGAGRVLRLSERVCTDCSNSEAKAKEAAHLAKLAELPLEERIARIERWIYHYREPPSTGLEIIGS